MDASPAPSAAAVIAAERHWLEQAVIGLNLCPFAQSVYLRNQVRFVVSEARTETELLADFQFELHRLQETPASAVDTTLLIHPYVLTQFSDYNEFLNVAEDALRTAGLVGEFQLASFHPQYQFAGTEPDDITNYTNRAPYPTLHLLREASVTRAVKAFPESRTIFEANIRTLQALGHDGWKQLGIGPASIAEGPENSPDASP